MKRNNFTKEQALKRMNAQMPQDDIINKSDFVIHNNLTKEELAEQVNELLNNFL